MLAIPRQEHIFVNRNLKMSEIDWVGFDMDYTLAIYQQPEMDQLQIQATLPKLVARGYPAFLQTMSYDIAFPMRGLLIDKKLGHVLKIDRHKMVQKAYHGLQALGKEDLRALYQQKKIRFSSDRYHWIDVLYALAEVALYTTVVEEMDRRRLFVDYDVLFRDIRECIDEAHRDGTVLDAVAGDYPRFVLRDPNLALTLHKWRSAGKRLFLLTNSRWTYTDRMMNYLLGAALPGYASWRHFFDVVIASASKPAFFEERRPLMERFGETLRPVTAPLERGRIYEGGNLHDAERLFGTTGDRILYVGDHIYGDILRSKKDSVWRTAMILQEMNEEVLANDASDGDLRRLAELEGRRRSTEDELRFLQFRYKNLVRPGNGALSTALTGASRTEQPRLKKAIDLSRRVLRTLEHDMARLESQIDQRFHGHWGSLLKEGNELSNFGKQVQEYACLYTSKVSNFLAYSPLQHFRSSRSRMAHEW